MRSCLHTRRDRKVCNKSNIVESNFRRLISLTLRVVLVMLLPVATIAPSKTNTHLHWQSSVEARKGKVSRRWHHTARTQSGPPAASEPAPPTSRLDCISEAAHMPRSSECDHSCSHLAEGLTHVLLVYVELLIACNERGLLHRRSTFA